MGSLWGGCRVGESSVCWNTWVTCPFLRSFFLPQALLTVPRPARASSPALPAQLYDVPTQSRGPPALQVSLALGPAPHGPLCPEREILGVMQTLHFSFTHGGLWASVRSGYQRARHLSEASSVPKESRLAQENLMTI